MNKLKTSAFLIGLLISVLQIGCSSVTFLPLGSNGLRPPKAEGYEVRVLESTKAEGVQIVGTVSCQDSATSSLWNGWTDEQALILEMQAGNRQRLIDKVREVGGDLLLDLVHDVSQRGSSGGVGVGVGMGSGPVGIGVGTSIFSGNPKIVVVSYGNVGVFVAED